MLSDYIVRPSEVVRAAEDLVAGGVKLTGKGLFAFVHHARAVAFERAAKVEAWRLRRAYDLIARAQQINIEKATKELV